ncbi:hypothetical protein BRADI_1g37611v3 [Brachypodium distachyon]|uniref:Uncharacterized protein n=1 Tax=Brachypodium distachyon TaxID=15368 RepID=A0A2K2DN82_BRADI|nr:hypothetical protein BRADI_1g37611v3 [Brachypodium distachyon]
MEEGHVTSLPRRHSPRAGVRLCIRGGLEADHSRAPTGMWPTKASIFAGLLLWQPAPEEGHATAALGS